MPSRLLRDQRRTGRQSRSSGITCSRSSKVYELVAVVGPPVAADDLLVQPGDLLAQLTDCERLQQASELGQRGRVQGCQLGPGNPHQPGREPRVDNMYLRPRCRAGAQRFAPCRQALEKRRMRGATPED